MFERIAWRRSWGWLGNVDNTMDIEGNFFAGRGVVVVGEAVDVSAVMLDSEGVDAGGDGTFVDLEVAFGVSDL